MVKRLGIGAGMDSIPTDTIPSDPTEFVNWFKGVGIARWFGPADVRNVLQGSGIEISGGSFTSPPTIAISENFQSLLDQPYVLLGSPVGGTDLTDYRSLAAQTSVLTITDSGAEMAVTIGVAPNGIGNTQLRQGGPFTVIGNPTAALANVEDLSQAQLTALIKVATASLTGAMPVLSGVATQFLNGVGAFSTPSAGASGANPSAVVGLTAVNGASASFMRADAAPPLSQSISPTMTGNWIFTPASGVPITVNGVAGAASVGIISGNSATAVIADLFVWRAAGTANAFSEGASFTLLETTAQVGASLQASGGQIELWQITGAGPAARQIWKVISGGGFVVAAPSSGDSITATSGNDLTGSMVTGAQNNVSMTINNTQSGATANWRFSSSATGSGFGAGNLVVSAGTTIKMLISAVGNVDIAGSLGINGNGAAPQVTGWGTPTGAAVVANFPGGGPATLAQCSTAIAEIIAGLKSYGLFGA